MVDHLCFFSLLELGGAFGTSDWGFSWSLSFSGSALVLSLVASFASGVGFEPSLPAAFFTLFFSSAAFLTWLGFANFQPRK